MDTLTSTNAEHPFKKLNNLWWVVAIGLVVLGAKVFVESWIAGIILVAFGFSVSPFIFGRILTKLSISDPLQIRVVVVLLALTTSTYALYQHTARIEAESIEQSRLQAIADAQALKAKEEAEAEQKIASAKAYFDEHRTNVLAEFASAVDAKNIVTAQAIRDRFIEAVRDPEFDLLLNRYIGLKDELALAEAEKARKTRLSQLTARLGNVSATDYSQAIDIYTQLTTLDPANKVYKQKLAQFTKTRDAEVARVEAARAVAAAKAARFKILQEQFSAYDGSHRKFERLIKEAMNDPSSYDHVETRYIDNGNYIRVFCTFRGKNAFGGLVKNTKVADFDIDGNLIKEVL